MVAVVRGIKKKFINKTERSKGEAQQPAGLTVHLQCLLPVHGLRTETERTIREKGQKTQIL